MLLARIFSSSSLWSQSENCNMQEDTPFKIVSLDQFIKIMIFTFLIFILSVSQWDTVAQ